jgi:hypothetical protein
MKRRRHHRDIRKYAHPRGKMKQELTIRQLAAIGAIALACNELELAVDTMLLAVIGQPHSALLEVSSGRINNMGDKIATIKEGVAHIGLNQDDQKQIKEALDIFIRFTVYRDAINHARIMNLLGRVRLDPKSRGTKSATLFSDDALNSFYDHLIALEKELSSAAMLIKGTSTLKSLAADDPKKGLYEEGKRVCSLQFRGYGTRRQTLPPIPYFPSESELREVKVNWQQAQQAEIMAWLSVWVGPTSSLVSGEGA